MRSTYVLIVCIVMIFLITVSASDDSEADTSVVFTEGPLNYYAANPASTVVSVGQPTVENGNALADHSVKDLVIPSTVSHGGRTYTVSGIMANAFSETAIEHLTVGSNVREICSYAFYKCSSLESISFSDGIRSIGDSAFSGCTSLASVSLGNNLQSVSHLAFSDCSKLTTFSVGSGDYSFSESSLLRCYALTHIYLYNSSKMTLRLDLGTPDFHSACCVIAYGSEVIVKNNTFTDIRMDDDFIVSFTAVTDEPEKGFVTGSGNYFIDEKVTAKAVSNEGYVFQEWSDGADEPNSRVFLLEGDLSITAYFGRIFNDGVYYYTEYHDGSVMLGTDRGQGNAVFDGSKISSDLPDSVVLDGTERTIISISDEAFYGSEISGELSLPGSVIKIGDRAFCNCSGLYGTLVIPDSVTEIGDASFRGCSYITCVNWGTETLPILGNECFALGTEDYHTSCNIQSGFRNGFLNPYRTGYTTFEYNSSSRVCLLDLIAGENGSVSGTGSFFEGDPVKVRAVADDGFEFVSWSDGSTESNRILYLDADTNLSATFREYTVLPGSPASGNIGIWYVLSAIVVLLVAVLFCIYVARQD